MASAARQLSLLISGLFGPAAAAAPRLPALETVLARADRLRRAAHSELESLVFDLFDISIEPGQDLPVAAVTRVLDLGVVDKSWWLRADPVHLQTQRDRLVLADGSVLKLTQEEANQLAAEITDAYAADGWVLKAAHPHRWYLRPPTVPEITTVPLPSVVGRDIHPFLPQGKDGKRWHTVLNELQILLHTARVNAAREERGAPPINSLWFWGGGRLPELKEARWSKVWSAEPVTLALARLSGTPAASLPATAAEWLATDTPGAQLIVLDGARAHVQYSEQGDWQAFVERLEADWISPLLTAVRARALERLTLHTESAPDFVLTRKAARRWWRRRRRLRSYT